MVKILMKIFYWSPFLSNIATVDAVAKSIKSILTYDKYKKFKPSIIDVAGEWDLKKHKVSNVNIIKLYNKNYFKNLPKGGYIKSRISQILIFLLNFIKLKKLIKKEKPDSIKGEFIKNIYITSTMGISYKVGAK